MLYEFGMPGWIELLVIGGICCVTVLVPLVIALVAILIARSQRNGPKPPGEE